MRLIASTLLAGVMALGAVAPALADPPRYQNSRDWNDRDHRRDYRDDRRDDRRDYRDDRRHDRWDDRRWHRGDRFDRRDTRYVYVRDYRDYRGYRLRAPRYGEYYVRDDRTGEILLIAAATGLVLWALNN
jgi:Ni/Co efflux regulator RcnB